MTLRLWRRHSAGARSGAKELPVNRVEVVRRKIFRRPLIVGLQKPAGVKRSLLFRGWDGFAGRLGLALNLDIAPCLAGFGHAVEKIKVVDQQQSLDGEYRGDILVVNRQQIVAIALLAAV